MKANYRQVIVEKLNRRLIQLLLMYRVKLHEMTKRTLVDWFCELNYYSSGELRCVAPNTTQNG